MKKPTSLRLRVTVGMALLTVLSLGIYSLLLYFFTDRMEDDLISRITSDAMDNFIAWERRNPAAPLPIAENIREYLVTDAASREQLPMPLRSLPVGEHEVFLNGSEHHVVIRDELDRRFILSYDKKYHEGLERDLAMLLFLGVGFAALASAALAYWAAGLLVRPVSALAQQVEHLGLEPPARPLALEYSEAEVQRLARVFDGYLQRVANLMQREREFTANISHELRTPLTAIRTSCELLLQQTALPNDARRRIEAIDRATGRLAETTRSLLFLARGTGDSLRLEEVSVKECVAEAAEPILPVLTRKGINFETAIDVAATVRANRTALLLVVDNLLRNAAYYTEHGRVSAVYRDGCLIIEDSGPGMDASVLPHLGERFFRGGNTPADEGLGLGLAIVKRLCERFDWRLEIVSTPGVGTLVSLRFPLPASQNLHNASMIS